MKNRFKRIVFKELARFGGLSALGSRIGKDGNRQAEDDDSQSGNSQSKLKWNHNSPAFLVNRQLKYQEISVNINPKSTATASCLSRPETNGVNTIIPKNTWPALSNILAKRNNSLEVNLGSFGSNSNSPIGIKIADNVFGVKRIFFFYFLLSTFYFLLSIPALADVESNSANYKVKTPTLDEAGPDKSSSNYKLGDSVGQTAQGYADSANYKLYAGFQYYGGALLTLSISCDSSVAIPAVTPGAPQSANNSCTITTNSTSGYTLYTWENNDLTRTSPPTQTIAAASLGSYGVPTPWSTGTTTGLGFSLSGSTIQAKWASGANFSSFETSSAAASTYGSALSGGSASVVSPLKLDTAATQVTGTYSNEIYYYITGSIL